jgi:hypothetical protein
MKIVALNRRTEKMQMMVLTVLNTIAVVDVVM